MKVSKSGTQKNLSSVEPDQLFQLVWNRKTSPNDEPRIQKIRKLERLFDLLLSQNILNETKDFNKRRT